MVKKENNIIEDITFTSSNQAVSRRVIYKEKDKKIQLTLKSDSYQMQCYAKAEILQDTEQNTEWKFLYSIPYSLMKTPNKLKYSLEAKNESSIAKNIKKYFDEDVKTLKSYVSKILD